jgi:hypothetical protein
VIARNAWGERGFASPIKKGLRSAQPGLESNCSASAKHMLWLLK